MIITIYYYWLLSKNPEIIIIINIIVKKGKLLRLFPEMIRIKMCYYRILIK